MRSPNEIMRRLLAALLASGLALGLVACSGNDEAKVTESATDEAAESDQSDDSESSSVSETVRNFNIDEDGVTAGSIEPGNPLLTVSTGGTDYNRSCAVFTLDGDEFTLAGNYSPAEALAATGDSSAQIGLAPICDRKEIFAPDGSFMVTVVDRPGESMVAIVDESGITEVSGLTGESHHHPVVAPNGDVYFWEGTAFEASLTRLTGVLEGNFEYEEALPMAERSLGEPAWTNFEVADEGLEFTEDGLLYADLAVFGPEFDVVNDVSSTILGKDGTTVVYYENELRITQTDTTLIDGSYQLPPLADGDVYDVTYTDRNEDLTVKPTFVPHGMLDGDTLVGYLDTKVAIGEIDFNQETVEVTTASGDLHEQFKMYGEYGINLSSAEMLVVGDTEVWLLLVGNGRTSVVSLDTNAKQAVHIYELETDQVVNMIGVAS